MPEPILATLGSMKMHLTTAEVRAIQPADLLHDWAMHPFLRLPLILEDYPNLHRDGLPSYPNLHLLLPIPLCHVPPVPILKTLHLYR